jgi:hypothetical protein
MERRHQRRITLAVLAMLSLLGSFFVVSAAPALAMPKRPGVSEHQDR